MTRLARQRPAGDAVSPAREAGPVLPDTVHDLFPSPSGGTSPWPTA